MADIKNIVEVLDFSIAVVGDLAKAKEDDDNIGLVEAVQIGLRNASGAIKAISEVNQVVVEAKDLSPDEIKVLAEKSVALAQVTMKLLGLVS